MGSPPSAELLSKIMARRQVTTLFQPVVDLSDRSAVGYEALSRGPAGPLHTPDTLFAAARTGGCNTQLDMMCRELAFAGARAAGLSDPHRLFLNAEPEAMLQFTAPSVDCGVPVVLELTERELATRPGCLLEAVALVRSLGWSTALDDMGAHPDSLALLSLLRPEVIKLDLRLIQQRPDRDCAALMSAVRARPNAPARCWSPRGWRRLSTWTSLSAWARPSVRAGCSAGPQHCRRRSP